LELSLISPSKRERLIVNKTLNEKVLSEKYYLVIDDINPFSSEEKVTG